MRLFHSQNSRFKKNRNVSALIILLALNLAFLSSAAPLYSVREQVPQESFDIWQEEGAYFSSNQLLFMEEESTQDILLFLILNPLIKLSENMSSLSEVTVPYRDTEQIPEISKGMFLDSLD